jgi:hypothetical protein
MTDKAALARFTGQTWRDLDSFYNFWIERWRQVLDFLRSQHWNTLQLTMPDSIPKWEEWPVVNFTGSMYADYLRQFLQAKVRFTAMPDSPDPREIASAELADHVLAYLWDKLVNPIRADLASWLIATGNAPVRVFWNANTGNLIPLAIPGKDAQGQPTLVPVNPATLQPDPTMKSPIMVDAGDIGIESLSPQLVRWPFAKAHGAMIGYLLSYDDAEDRYGKEQAEKLHYEASRGGMVADLMTINVPGAVPSQMERALVIEHYLPKSYRNPKGLWWTVSGTDVITDPIELPSNEPPVVNIRWVPMPGHHTLGMSPLFDVRNANKVFEKSLKRTLEWQKKVVPKTLLTAGGGVKKGDITDEPAQELLVNQGAAPTYTTVPQPPETFERVRNEILQVIKSVGLYGMERPPQGAPGESLPRLRTPAHTLNENQEVQLAVINSGEAFTKIGYVILDFVGKFYTDEKSIGIVGPDRSYQWISFKGSDLKDMRATLRIDELSLYTWNRQSIRDAVIGVLGTQAGQLLFQDDSGGLDRDRLDAAFEAAGLDQGLRSMDIDVLEARNENNAFRNLQSPDQAPKVSPWQNHATHLTEHYKDMKSVEFQARPPELQQAMLQHTAQHEQAQQELMAQQQKVMLDQEQQLRTIRMQTDSAGNVRSALGDALAKLLAEHLAPPEPGPNPKGRK